MKVLNFDKNSIIHPKLKLKWSIAQQKSVLKQYNQCNVVIISIRFCIYENHPLVLSPQFSAQ